jgi:hypothetical protein
MTAEPDDRGRPAPRDDVTPDEDPMEQRRDDAADPRRRRDEGASPAESTEPGYQDIDDRDGVQ